MNQLTAYKTVTTKRLALKGHFTLHFTISSIALISLYGRFGMGLFECWIF
ncbi:hypothetical protein KDU71_15405 [Carboxylicivirga sediminis]|uniref:Uncharacterized protein n=1 Tax=Carboxylicivirga sediminis TaxID=2006564 RepID=A0A941F798_9BACT|nr:hypothetical protein [Carboxylicivirga sediminis]MBR8536959.1 hypothetical protein [Carboxylicivirga sediminis]